MRFLIAIRTPFSISRSIEGTLEGIDTAKHALKLAPSKRDQRYYPTIIRFATHHIRDHANTEREVIAVPFALASLPPHNLATSLFLDTRIIREKKELTKLILQSEEMFPFHSLEANSLILLN